MKKSLIFVIVFGVSGILHAEENITVVTENWKPYNYEENGVIKGTSTETVRAVLDRAGIKYAIRIYPWARAYHMAQKEKNVLIYTIIRMPPRENLFKWVRPLAESDTSSLYKLSERKDIAISSLEDAKRHRIGVVRHAMNQQYLLSQGFENRTHLEAVTEKLQNVKKLLAKRVDLIVYSRQNFNSEMKAFGVSEDKLEEVFLLFRTFPYMAFSKATSDELVERVRKSYDQLVAEGKINKFK